MKPSAPVKFSDLMDALDWVSGAPAGESEAYVERATGTIYLWSSMVEADELPANVEDTAAYVAVPHKHDFDLGRRLALAFTAERLADAYPAVEDFFRKRGAYGRFKDLLERRNLLEAWYQYEADATAAALRAWSDEQDIRLLP